MQKTILVIEDDLAINNNICTILQISGYNCVSTYNGIDGVEKLQSLVPDLILCDVMMSGLSGFEVLSSISIQIKEHQIPFCFLTARADIVDIDYGISIGAKAYITKPFLVKDLLSTVQKLLEQKPAQLI